MLQCTCDDVRAVLSWEKAREKQDLEADTSPEQEQADNPARGHG